MEQIERPTNREVAARLVRVSMLARRMRDASFPANLFGEPAWDCLLELYAALLEQRRISISDVGVGAAVPPTTVIRWLDILQQKELARRIPDRRDARRCFVELTPKGEALMKTHFDRVASLWDGCFA